MLAILAGLGTVVALHLVDLVTGAHLEWNTVFGYSPTIGIRFVGQGNMTFSQLTAAAVLFAGLLAWQVPTRRGVSVAVALLAVTVIVMGAPFWGNDFGGAVSAAPGFALLAWLLLGHELRWRTVWMLVGVLVAAGLVVGVVDVLRPADQRTHVGKFFEKAGTDFGARDARAPAQGVGEPLDARALAPALLPASRWSCWWSTSGGCGRVRCARWSPACRRRVPPRSRSRLVAVLGFALNDSGITIPSMMAAVTEATVVVLLARAGVPHPEQPNPSAARAAARAQRRTGPPSVTVVVAFLVGLVTVRFLRMVSGDILSSPALERSNYRGHRLATAGGLFIILTVLVIDAGRSVLGAVGVGSEAGLTQARLAVLFAVFGFGFLGMIDDLAAVGEDRGFKGHLGALREGRVTTGLLKLVGGAAVAIVIVATPGVQVGPHAASSTPRSSRSPPTSATSSTARPGARSSSDWSPTCRSRSPSAPRPSASPPRR